MLPAYAKAHGIEYSVREGWLTGCLDRLQKEKNTAVEEKITLAIAFPSEGPVSEGKEIVDEITYYGFNEDLIHPENYDESLETRFKQIIEDFVPDIVHVFGTEFPHALAALRAFGRPERSLVGIQGVCTEIAKAYMAGLPKKVQESTTFRDRLKEDSLIQQQEKFKLRAENEKKVLLLTGNVTGRTTFDKEASHSINPRAEYFAMNETMRPCFYSGKWEERKAIPHSIFLSQGDYPLKGFHFLLEAMPLILKKYPDAHVYVAGNNIIGRGKSKYPYFMRASAYGKYLKRLIAMNRLRKKVTMVGSLSDVEMKNRFLMSSVFVCASVVENSPNSVGEAMLLGVPVVAANAGGIPDMITDGMDGIIFDNMDYKKLAEAILQMWDEPVIAAVYGDNASKRAAKTHNADINYKRLLEIYDAICRK